MVSHNILASKLKIRVWWMNCHMHKELARWSHAKSCKSYVQCPSENQKWVVSLKGLYWDKTHLMAISMTYIVGSSAPSGSLQMTVRWVMQLITKECHPEGPWQYLGPGPGESHGAQRGQMKGPVSGMNWGWMDWKQSWGGLVDEKLVMNWQPTEPTLSWAASKAAWPSGQGRGFCPSVPALVKIHLECCNQLWSPNQMKDVDL